MIKTYYQHSIWSEDPHEWIESDKETFEDEVIAHRSSFVQRYNFESNQTIYYFDNKFSSAYDWKVIVNIE